jgi:hypothetical protein
MNYQLSALLTVAANAAYYHFGMLGYKTFWQLHLWNSYLFQANRFITDIANKMYMIIVVVAFFAVVFTQGI